MATWRRKQESAVIQNKRRTKASINQQKRLAHLDLEATASLASREDSRQSARERLLWRLPERLHVLPEG